MKAKITRLSLTSIVLSILLTVFSSAYAQSAYGVGAGTGLNGYYWASTERSDTLRFAVGLRYVGSNLVNFQADYISFFDTSDLDIDAQIIRPYWGYGGQGYYYLGSSSLGVGAGILAGIEIELDDDISFFVDIGTGITYNINSGRTFPAARGGVGVKFKM